MKPDWFDTKSAGASECALPPKVLPPPKAPKVPKVESESNKNRDLGEKNFRCPPPKVHLKLVGGGMTPKSREETLGSFRCDPPKVLDQQVLDIAQDGKNFRCFSHFRWGRAQPYINSLGELEAPGDVIRRYIGAH